jgi:CheY-like chemotaxis protein
MRAHKYPISIRLLGFDAEESAQLCAQLARGPKSGTAYFCLHADSLQEPDLFIANADDVKALAALTAANPAASQPALVIGEPPVALAFPVIARPIDEQALHALLGDVVERRSEERAHATARGLPVVPERRRRKRLDFDLTDPAIYNSLRKAPPTGAVLIVDKGGAFRDHVAKLMAGRDLSVEWTDSPATAVRLCEETPVAVVIINTSTPGIDAYGLAKTIKGQSGALRIAVVLLVSPSFAYNSARAKASGVRGLLDKPVGDRHLVGALKKLLSLPS